MLKMRFFKTLFYGVLCFYAFPLHAQNALLESTRLLSNNMAQISQEAKKPSLQNNNIHKDTFPKEDKDKHPPKKQHPHKVHNSKPPVLHRPAPTIIYHEKQTVGEARTTFYYELANYILKHAHSDLDKARLLAHFVAGNYKPNAYEKKQLKKADKLRVPARINLINNFEETHIGSSFDFAQFYADLCPLVDLECTVITGYADENLSHYIQPTKVQALTDALTAFGYLREEEKQSLEGAWNAVFIAGKWILLDTYMMVKSYNNVGEKYSSDKEMNKFLSEQARYYARRYETPAKAFRTNVNEKYFNQAPRTFIKTHYPFDPEWQLLPIPTKAPDIIR